MTNTQCRLIAFLCVATALGLAWHFVEYRSKDETALHSPPGLIIPIRERLRTPDGPIEPTPPPGDWRIKTQDGIYARPEYTTGGAFVGGILIPVLLVAGAYYAARRRKQPT
jgi:hypothetical protein